MRSACQTLPACLLVLGVLSGCLPGGPRTANVVIVVIDTLRADRLGAYGNSRGLTPFLDELAARGVVYHRAYAAASWTQPSVASLFTSRFQSQHGVVYASVEVRADEVTLAEVLHERGWATGAFSANALIARQFGYAQGFEEYIALWGRPPDMKEKYRAEEINALARTWLERADVAKSRPVFLYVQYLEPHAPFSPPEAMLRRTLGDRPLPDLRQVSQRLAFGNLGHPRGDALREIEDVYDAEVASADAGVRELCQTLEALGLLDDSQLVETSDHGEAFMEHGLTGHGNALYDEVIRVPLIVVPPGGTRRIDVDQPVSLLDVAPTVLALLGIPAPATFEGHAVLPAALRPAGAWLDRAPAPREAPVDRPVFSEHIMPKEQEKRRLRPHERAVITQDAKLIVGVGGEREAFDLAADSAERTPLPDDRVAPLAGLLDSFGARVAGASYHAPPVDSELRKRLDALGYFD